MRDPGDERGRQERHEREDEQRAVEGEHQLAEVDQDVEPAVAHRHRHRRADADRCIAHDDGHELEHHLHQSLAPRQHRLLGAALHLRKRDGEQRSPEHHLKHLALRRRLEEAPRHHVLEESAERGRRGLRQRGVRIGRGQHHADAGLGQVPGDQSDRERDRRHDPEVADRLDGEPADPLEVVAVARDADHQRAEDDRDDDRLDQPEEDGGERLDVRGEVPAGELVVDVADQDPDRHADEDPAGQRDAPQRG